MRDERLVRTRARTHAIVEGALLGDITIVFLLMRAFFPVPPVRALIKAVAVIPFIMLTQRRGIKLTILAGLASYILFSALVGPLLGLAAVDVAVAGILIGAGRRWGLNPAVNTVWTAFAYTILDILIPTVVSIFIFRYPIPQLVKSARNFVDLIFRFGGWVLQEAHAPASAISTWQSWRGPVSDHWIFAWIAVSFVYGLLNIYLAVLVSEMVLRQIPEQTLVVEEAA
jgi:hypothetical protein